MHIAAVFLASADDISIFERIARLGGTVFLVILVYGFVFRKWIVPLWFYQELEDRHAKLHERFERLQENSDAWRDAAVRAASVAESGSKTVRTIAEEALARGRKGERGA
jgi:hypothetical protein